jgi:hypothetical protein
MRASPARLLAAAKHLQRMREYRQMEIDKGIPTEERLSGEALGKVTADPADELTASMLLNRSFKADNPTDPIALADQVIERAKDHPPET